MKVVRSGEPSGWGNPPFSEDVTMGIKTDGTIIEWNSSAEALFEYPSVEALGNPISMLFTKKQFEKESGILESVKHGSSRHYEIYCKTRSGKKLLISFVAYPVFDKTGQIVAIGKMAYDLSREEEAVERLASLQTSVFYSEEAIISKNLDGIITGWNPAATRLFGYTESEAIGRPITMIIPKDSLDEEELIVENIRKGRIIEQYDTVRVAKDGTEKQVSLSIFPVRNQKGKVVGVSKIARDLSQKDRDYEKLATLAAIVNSSDDAIISKNLDGIITSWNASARRMFGYTESEAIGKHISLIIPKERLGEETRIIGSIRRGEKIDHFETVRVAKDGTQRFISLTVSPIKNSRGKIVGASKVARDISSRLETEKQRRLYTERLKELNKYKDEFMVMASHELKTPLTVIMANLQLLNELMQNDKNAIFVKKAVKQVEKLSVLITDLLDVSKIQAGKLIFRPVNFDLNQLLDETVANLQQTTKNQKIVFTSSGEDLLVCADRERIEQVIVNIVNNAIKYSRTPGDVVVNAFRKDENIEVNVTDKGIGIPQKDIENIFLRFFRVSGSATSFSGSGIGLYISAEIIKSHGGRIWAESKVGKGSVFHFSLPAVNK